MSVADVTVINRNIIVLVFAFHLDNNTVFCVRPYIYLKDTIICSCFATGKERE